MFDGVFDICGCREGGHLLPHFLVQRRSEVPLVVVVSDSMLQILQICFNGFLFSCIVFVGVMSVKCSRHFATR